MTQRIMTQHNLTARVVLAAAALAPLTAPAFADDAADIPVQDTIVVTATKSELEILEVPAAISVVTLEKIEAQGAQTAVEALQGEPGVRISTYTEGSFPIVQIRSSGDAGQFQNTDVLVLIDGIPQVNLNDQSYYDQIPFEAIERIEVVRGPTSAL